MAITEYSFQWIIGAWFHTLQEAEAQYQKSFTVNMNLYRILTLIFISYLMKVIYSLSEMSL